MTGGVTFCGCSFGSSLVFGELEDAPPGPRLNFKMSIPGFTVVPSSTSKASITPEAGELMGIEVLSVSISPITSSSFTESPTAGGAKQVNIS